MIDYKWKLKDAIFSKDKGKVFSCFSCGGGSTMGYKLAGFDVIGCNEIDKRMMDCYIENHKPKYSFLCDIRDLKPNVEMYELDILDGSPPCSSFSTAGLREDGWGKEKSFKEGQSKQVLDTLFFDFISLAKELQPKIVIAENVKGLIFGNAVKYVHKIYKEFDNAGYCVKHFLLNSSKMGVPQRRERVFFIAVRKDLISFFEFDFMCRFPILDMEFNEKPITIKEIDVELGEDITTPSFIEEYNRLKRGEQKKYFCSSLFSKSDVFPTLTASYRSKSSPYPDWECKWLSKRDLCRIGSYPFDYNFLNQKPEYLIGMSVPPIMMYKIATRVLEQLLSKLPKFISLND
jgi:DNA (cytosine-5)-methyltransferase 1